MERLASCVVCMLISGGIIGGITGIRGYNSEDAALNSILNSYNPNARPVRNHSQPVNVRIDLLLRQLIHLDERSELLRTSVALRLLWTDEYLSWNESDFDGVNTLRIFPTDIWKPDITLYNEVTDEQQNLDDIYPVILKSDGSAKWLTKRIYTSTCQIDVSDFPWDTQRCNLSFGSWTYDIMGINFTSLAQSAEIDSFTPNGEWVLDGVPAVRNVLHYACCEHPFTVIDFTIILSRKPLYYIVNLLIPCLCVTIVGVMVFCLPVDSGEKVSLSVTVLLSATVFLLILSDTLPTQSEVVPQAGQFFMAVIIFMSLSTVFTVIVLNIHNRGKYGNRVPAPIRRLFIERVGKVAMRTARKSLTGQGDGEIYKLRSARSNSGLVTPAMSSPDLEHPTVIRRESSADVYGTGRYATFDAQMDRPTSEIDTTPKMQWNAPVRSEVLLDDIATSLGALAKQRVKAEDQESIEGEWMYLALLLDRTLLIMFLLTITITTVVIFWPRSA